LGSGNSCKKVFTEPSPYCQTTCIKSSSCNESFSIYDFFVKLRKFRNNPSFDLFFIRGGFILAIPKHFKPFIISGFFPARLIPCLRDAVRRGSGDFEIFFKTQLQLKLRNR
jgi:hypothetical protein